MFSFLLSFMKTLLPCVCVCVPDTEAVAVVLRGCPLVESWVQCRKKAQDKFEPERRRRMRKGQIEKKESDLEKNLIEM